MGDCVILCEGPTGDLSTALKRIRKHGETSAVVSTDTSRASSEALGGEKGGGESESRHDDERGNVCGDVCAGEGFVEFMSPEEVCACICVYVCVSRWCV